ncbi:MAG: NADH-quinone oxidoreductase subunit NuoF [Planctomycetota bacterium]
MSLPAYEPVLLKYANQRGMHTLDAYLGHGGYSSAKKALAMKPAEVTQAVKDSGLRGRGGAGFPTGMKWGFVPPPEKVPGPRYLCVNADESEPGTFKDRYIMEGDPHQLLEGIIITCYAIGSNTAYIYIRGEFALGAKIMEKAIEEAYRHGAFGANVLGSGFKLDCTLHRGAGAYICGEETGLLSSLEGNRGYPRIKPPFPAVVGAFGQPTIINNVETIANVPHIIERGAAWFKAIGPSDDPGPKLYCCSGHVKNPGYFEGPMGVTIRSLIHDYAGGMIDERPLKAIIAGGSSCPWIAPDKIDTPLGFESLKKVKTMFGSAGTIILNDSVCVVDAMWNILRFYAHESCGQCTPCREGCGWLAKIFERIERGGGREDDIATVLDICDNMRGKTICVLADAAAWPVQSILDLKNYPDAAVFRPEVEAHIREKKCPMGKHKPVHAEAVRQHGKISPKLVV